MIQLLMGYKEFFKSGKMPSKLCIVLIMVLTRFINILGDDIDFVWNGFLGKNMSMEGLTKITDNSLLQLTNTSTKNQLGHAFFPLPLSFPNISNFSTTFVLAIVPEKLGLGGNGMAFAISPSPGILEAEPRQFLGLFNMSNHGSKSNQIFAIEFDTIQSPEFEDIENEHVGMDVNSLISVNSTSAGYFVNGRFENLTLDSGKPIQVWIEYVKNTNQLYVTMAPLGMSQPTQPLLSTSINLSSIVAEYSYVGFSAATGVLLSSHYVLGWSFTTNGQAKPLDLSLLPRLPDHHSTKKPNSWKIGVGVLSVFLAIATVTITLCGFHAWRKKRKVEVLESWEHEIGAHRIYHKDLCTATKRFAEAQVIGSGGFGKVYKGVLPGCGTKVAVKRVCHNPEAGMEQFLAEIRSIGRIRHEKLVKLIGYCRLRGELLLIYELLENGSLDKFLYGNSKVVLIWMQRFQIIKDVAAGLLFLHEEWERVVIHRDIKGSNVLLDKQFNAKLGDFGLSRLCEHGKDPKAATRIAGTVGYMAPEVNTTGIATKSSDVYAYGAFLLEVVCGRRPFDAEDVEQRYLLVTWVLECFERGSVIDAADKKMTNLRQKEIEEVELVLKIGLLCMQHVDTDRPTMQELVKFLEGKRSLPNVSSSDMRGRVSSILPATSASHINVGITRPPDLESVSVLRTGR